MTVAIICILVYVCAIVFCCSLCVVAWLADDESDRCYKELAAKDCEQLTDESPPPAPRRVGLRVTRH